MSIQRAVIFSLLQRYYAFIVAFVSTIVFSRLLTPADLGAFSVAMSVAGVVTGLREFGASAFLVRSPVIEKRHESSAFGVTLFLGASLGAVLLALARPMSAFFGQESVADLVRILSLNLFLLPLGTVNGALLRRQMSFDILARVSVIAVTLSFLVTLTCAWLLEWGAYSLAWGTVTTAVTSAILSNYWGPSPFFIWPSFKGAREMIRFGAQTTGLSVLWEFTSRYSDFIIGRLQGFTATGLMSRATGLASNVNDLLCNGLYSVALPYFSQIQRDNGDPVLAHLKIATLITGLGWPVFIALAFFAEPLTLALYGEKWLGIVRPLQILCLSYALGLPFCFQYEVVIAKGYMTKQVRAVVIIEVFRIAAVSVGVMGGLNGVATALVATQVCAIVICSFMVWPSINVKWSDYWRVVKTNLAISVIAVFVCWVVMTLANFLDVSYVYVVLVCGPAAILGVIAGYFAVRHPLLVEVAKLMKLRRSA